MYIEEEYIYNQFVQNFIQDKSAPIVLYGTGLNTKKLLERLPKENRSRVAGLMDAKRTGEELWGSRVLSYDEVALIENCVIVIIARNAVIHVIYDRIKDFCRDHHIAVYDVNGNKLEEGTQGIEHPCFSQKESELRGLIEQYDMVSFDIFDTLLARKIQRPRDIFEVIDSRLEEQTYCFSGERIEAEDSFPGGYHPNFHEIYEKMQNKLGLSADETENLKQLEIAVEKQFLTPRHKMCEILQWAAKIGKRVYLVSDMYWTREMLEELLTEFGISGYENIWVSCEYRKSKQAGLYERYKEETEGKGPGRYLHIGDNLYSDILAAQSAGIDAYQIYSVQEKLERSIYAKCLSHVHSLEENIAVSVFAETAFNDPFRMTDGTGKLKIADTAEMTRLCIAPVICKYVLWLIQKVTADGCDFVIFPSRDGFLIEKMYQRLAEHALEQKLPEGKYVYTSRRSSLIAAAEKEEDIREIVGFIFVEDTAELFRKRFGIELPESAKRAGKTAQEIAGDMMEELLCICKTESKNYRKYLQQFSLSEKKKIAFMDFLAMGTVQEALERILGRTLEGYYFLRRSGTKEKLQKLQCQSLYPMAGDFQMDENIYRFYYFLEAIITSYEPTFWGIDEQGEKIFYKEKRDVLTMNILKDIHEAILTQWESFLELLPNIRESRAGVELYDCMLGFFSSEYTDIDTGEIEKLINIDEFMGKKVADLNR